MKNQSLLATFSLACIGTQDREERRAAKAFLFLPLLVAENQGEEGGGHGWKKGISHALGAAHNISF